MTLAKQLKGIERIIALHDLSHKADKYFRLAGHEIDCMRAVAETLRGLMEIGDIRLLGTRPDRGISPIVVWPEDTK